VKLEFSNIYFSQKLCPVMGARPFGLLVYATAAITLATGYHV